MKVKKSTEFRIGSLTKWFIRLNMAVLFAAALCASVSVAGAQSPPIDVTLSPYYAVGDGATDNRSRIQHALDDAALAGGGTVYFRAGIYNVGNTLYVPSNVRVQGMGSHYFNFQIRLTRTSVPLFEVEAGGSNIIFKDLLLYSANGGTRWPDVSPAEATLIRGEDTTGISLKGGDSKIFNIVIENVRISRFTYGVSATAPRNIYDAIITDIKIRNYASDGNEYSLYTNAPGADDWDVQNMNVYPMYKQQNGIFLARSGQMRFLNLSCAGTGNPNELPAICAKLWNNGDTYFRDMHVEGPEHGFWVENEPNSLETPPDSVVTVENSATEGSFYRATNLVSINNRFWIDLSSPRFHFIDDGANSVVNSCGDVWVKWNPSRHRLDTTVSIPFVSPPNEPHYPDAFPGLNTPLRGCDRNLLLSVPTFSQGYADDNERLNGEINVLAYGATSGGGDDWAAFDAALTAARNSGTRRVFVPPGTFDISQPIVLHNGETFLGAEGSTINLMDSNVDGNFSLFKVVAIPSVEKAITLRNLVLTSTSSVGTVGIDLVNFDNNFRGVAGGASDFQIQNVDFIGFDKGISVHNFIEDEEYANPMFDSVSVKDADFSNNNTAILIGSSNASNWNLENIRVNIPNGKAGVRINGAGVASIRNLTCTGSGTGEYCVKIQRQAAISIDGMSATGVTNALVASWENGWTQFPVTLRNSNLLAGVYFEGRIYLNSVNNLYPARLRRQSFSKQVKFGAQYDGDPRNDISYGALSDIFSCNDTFTDTYPWLNQSTWAYIGPLPSTNVRYCY